LSLVHGYGQKLSLFRFYFPADLIIIDLRLAKFYDRCMNSSRLRERYLWGMSVLLIILILFMAAWGPAIQKQLEKVFGKEILITITLFFVVIAVIIFRVYVFKTSSNRLRRLLLFLTISMIYAWRIFSLHVQVERFHLIEYGLLAILICLASQHRDYGYAAYGFGIAAVWFVGMSDELFQWWLPTRVGEWRDVVINIQSGFLGLFTLGIVQNKSIWRKHPPGKIVVWVLILFGFLSVISGQFILKIHVFGNKNSDSSIGKFNSICTASQLLEADNQSYISAVDKAGGHQSDSNITDHYLYFYEKEAKEHFDKTLLFIELNRLNEAKSESSILEKYYRPWMNGNSVYFSQSTKNLLESVSNVDADNYYSEVMNWLIVGVTRKEVIWLSLLVALVFFMFSIAYYRLML